MDQLNYQVLENSGYQGYILKDAPVKVMQFGEGNFLRAFVDYWFDLANEKGVWNGKGLLDENWFEEGMSAQIMQNGGQDLSEEEIAILKQDEWNHGYGYQMWISSDGAPRLDGAGGQICVIYPEKNLVIAVHCHTNDTMGLLKSIRTRVASQF